MILKKSLAALVTAFWLASGCQQAYRYSSENIAGNIVKHSPVFSNVAYLFLSKTKLSEQQSKKRKMGTKYAVISTGASLRNKEEGLIDPIDKNAFWHSTVKVYNELLRNGYLPRNIRVLYQDADPPFNDQELLNEIKKIKLQFHTGKYLNLATAQNLRKVLNDLEKEIQPEDSFTLYLNQHGSPLGYVLFEYDESHLFGSDLTEILQGNKSKNILIVADVCHAEQFTDDLNYPATIISSSKEDQLGWGDRNYSFGRIFFAEMNNHSNDLDRNEEISPYEAFQSAKQKSLHYRQKMDNFLRNKYEGKGIPEAELEIITLLPVYKERLD